MVLERFFTLTNTPSIMPVMPSASVIDVRPPIRSGRPTVGGVHALEDAVVHGQHVVLLGLLQEDRLEFCQLLRVLRREIVGQAEVRAHVVQLPRGVVLRASGAAWHSHGALWMVRANQPSW